MDRTNPAWNGLASAAGLILGATSLFLNAPVFAASLTLDLPNCASVSATANGSTVSVSCSTTTSPPPPPATGQYDCSVKANGSNPASIGSGGGPVALGVSCANGPAWSRAAWTKNGASFGNGGYSQSDSLGANTLQAAITIRYQVDLYLSSSVTPDVSRYVDVTQQGTTATGSSGGGGTTTGSLSCPQAAKTLVLDMPWVSNTSQNRQNTSSLGGFGPNDILVVRFSVPAGVVSSQAGNLGLAEYGGGPVVRYATLSETPCDFSKTQWSNDVFSSATISFPVYVGVQAPAYGGATLQAGRTYYLNIRNTDRYGNPTGGNCDLGICNMALDFLKPLGT